MLTATKIVTRLTKRVTILNFSEITIEGNIQQEQIGTTSTQM